MSSLQVSFDGLYSGSYLAAAFCGFTSHQTYVYFRQSTGDALWMRLMVLILWMADVMHAVLAATTLHQIAVIYALDPLILFRHEMPWILWASFFIMVITDTAVRSFYCYRIWRLSEHNPKITIMAALPVICALAPGIYATSRTVGRSGIVALGLTAEIEATLISALISDIVLAGFQCLLLRQARPALDQDTSVIGLLVLYTATTGVLTSVVSIATLVIMLKMRHTFAFDGAFYTLSGMYFSSLLATLNRCEDFRARRTPAVRLMDTQISPLSATKFISL